MQRARQCGLQRALWQVQRRPLRTWNYLPAGRPIHLHNRFGQYSPALAWKLFAGLSAGRHEAALLRQGAAGGARPRYPPAAGRNPHRQAATWIGGCSHRSCRRTDTTSCMKWQTVPSKLCCAAPPRPLLAGIGFMRTLTRRRRVASAHQQDLQAACCTRIPAAHIR